MSKVPPPAVVAATSPVRRRPSVYPEPFASRMAGREKQVLGAIFGLSDFGVNLTRLAPGSVSSLRHAHTTQDEFIYVLEGEATLVTEGGETPLRAGMCAGFRAGSGNAHHVVNRSGADLMMLEVGSRTPGDAASYPDDDLQAAQDAGGAWVFMHKDGRLY